MALSAFDDKAREPAAAELEETLGRAHAAWVKLPTLVAERIGEVAHVWKFAGKSFGWSLRLVRGKRVIVYMTPQRAQFLVSFVLGEKAVVAAHAARLPADVLRAIDEAPRYAEGRGIRLPVRSATLLPALARLADIKSEN